MAVSDVLGALVSRDAAATEERVEVRTAITIAKPSREVYAFWRGLERLPSLRHLPDRLHGGRALTP